ncbi:uncharacterized protein Bfra_004141 [Botrytis fragariae]|uniref:Uncharacterized protein n=1 Tax=Botrytis fragariae TaxID=1964551 RepID=A0A8H6AUX8_9HELO|nr:uncharacterized protein Bfra_004141 [Botrytis fragariae]KAF5874134.1 hypothetical protein Bfra_004141 [Botrytis fragariae]
MTVDLTIAVSGQAEAMTYQSSPCPILLCGAQVLRGGPTIDLALDTVHAWFMHLGGGMEAVLHSLSARHEKP